MSAKMKLERARSARDPPTQAELDAARLVVEAAPRQPPIAEPLLQDDPTLASVRPPPTEWELAELSGLSAHAAAERNTPRHGCHFGHEDLMGQQLPPPAATPREPPPPPPLPVGVVAYGVGTEVWSDEWSIAEGPEVDGALAEVAFADGSRCSCGPRCGASDALECCARWEVRC